MPVDLQNVGEGWGTQCAFENGFVCHIRNVETFETGDRDKIDLSSCDSNETENEPSSIMKTGGVRVTMLYKANVKPPFDAAPSQCTITNPKGFYRSGVAWLAEPGQQIPYRGEMIQTCTLHWKNIPAFSAT